MKTHTTLGRDAIVAAEELMDAPGTFLDCAREIAYVAPGEVGRIGLSARASRATQFRSRRG